MGFRNSIFQADFFKLQDLDFTPVEATLDKHFIRQ